MSSNRIEQRGRVVAAAAALMVSPWAAGGIPVLQVEAWNAATGTQNVSGQIVTLSTYSAYSPVDFTGFTVDATLPGAGNFTGLTFHLADAYTAAGSTPQATASTSVHAGTVATAFYASGKPGNPAGTNAGEITDVWVNATTGFYNNVVKWDTTLGQQQALPNYLYGKSVAPTGSQVIRVVNNSYAYDSDIFAAYASYPNMNENAVRRLDFMAARENAVFVSGAVSYLGSSSKNLSWSMWNGLAVRGADISQVFDPATSATPGKRRADLWGDASQGYIGSTSYVAGTVSGYAAGLIYRSTTLGSGYADAGKSQVVRSLLMTGADRSKVLTMLNNGAPTSTTYTWARETQNNLSVKLGAGQADYAKALSILTAGKRNVAAVSDITPGSAITSPTIYTNLQGWSSANVAKSGEQVMLISVPAGQAITDLVATLTWDVSQNTQTQGPNTYLDTRDTARIFADLNLSLWTVNGSAGSYTLGSAVGYAGLTSNITGDNLESLYWKAAGGESIGAGTYAFLISDVSASTTVTTTDYGFSYSMGLIAVPEPAALSLLVLGGLILNHRGRRRA